MFYERNETMQTKTLVEINNKELVDLVIDAAKKAIKPGPGPVKTEFRKSDGTPLGVDGIIAVVAFEWGAKPSGG
jgi:hypothetical protein